MAKKQPKTTLSRQELARFRALLLEKRGELVGDLSAVEDEAADSDSGNLSHVPFHSADLGTDTFDQDVLRTLAEGERALLAEIDAALERIARRTYGICEATGEPIPIERLEAQPWARYTVEAARRLER
jgi:RNA polymerase-binding protein DksA